MSKSISHYAHYLFQFIDKNILYNEEPHLLFKEAVYSNCPNLLKIILKLTNNNYPDLNKLDEDGNAPLHIAAKNSYFFITELLTKQPNININQLTNSGLNALHLAVNNYHYSTIVELIIANIDVTITDNSGETPLGYILKKKIIPYKGYKKDNQYAEYLDVIKKLLEAGADTNLYAEEEHIAFKLLPLLSEDTGLANLLISYGLDINVYNKQNNSLLYTVIKSNYTSLIDLLINHHVDIDAINENQDTVLHLAIKKYDYKTIDKLIKVHAKLDIANVTNSTPLMLAINEANRGYKDMLNIIKLLVNTGDNINYVNANGEHIIHYFLNKIIVNKSAYAPQIMETLLECKINVNQLNQDNQLPLARIFSHINKGKEYREISLLLINAGAIVNFKIEDDTPLHFAIKYKHNKLVEALLAHGASVNKLDTNGDTPLHIAIRQNKFDIMKLLLDHNANLAISNNNGETPIDLAIGTSFTKFSKLLLINLSKQLVATFPSSTTDSSQLTITTIINQQDENLREIDKKHKALLNSVDNQGNTLMHIMVNNGNIQFVKMLLQQPDCNINAVNRQLDTPLHIAIKKGDIELVKLLLEAQADLNITNADGYTPLFLAANHNNSDIANLILHNNQSTTINSSSDGLPKVDSKSTTIANSVGLAYKESIGSSADCIGAKNDNVHTVIKTIDYNNQVIEPSYDYTSTIAEPIDLVGTIN